MVSYEPLCFSGLVWQQFPIVESFGFGLGVSGFLSPDIQLQDGNENEETTGKKKKKKHMKSFASHQIPAPYSNLGIQKPTWRLTRSPFWLLSTIYNCCANYSTATGDVLTYSYSVPTGCHLSSLDC